MQRVLQYPVAAGLLALGAVALLGPGPSEPPVGRAAGQQPAVHQPYTETIPGTKVKFDLVAIPGGTYLRGSPPGEPGRGDDEGPQHPVTIRPFWMGKCEVTWDEYDLYWQTEQGASEDKQAQDDKLKGVDAITRPTPPYTDMTFGYGHDGFPAICMTHHAAMEYCRWLSARTGKTYRLPTEAEWEYACRAGTQTAYFFGDDPKPLGDYAWFAGNSEEAPHPVGKKKPNPWGLYDILGNVAEWCIDPYEKDAYRKYPTDRPTLGPVLLSAGDRFPDVARGGSWADPAARVRCATRLASNKSWIQLDPQRPQSIWWLTSAEFVGFRVVRPVEEQDNLKGLRSKVTRESK
jgi:formylglycine-generating enzyme required for sulfatase activity